MSPIIVSLYRIIKSDIRTHIMEPDSMIGPVTLRDMTVEGPELKVEE